MFTPKFKVGDEVYYTDAYASCHTGKLAVLDTPNSEGADYKVKQIENGDQVFYIPEETIKSAHKSFDEIFDLVRPHLPRNTNHTQITPNLRAYRSDDGYLAIDNFYGSSDNINMHRHNFKPNAIVDAVYEFVAKELETVKPVEVTMEDVAKAMGIDVKKLRIKE